MLRSFGDRIVWKSQESRGLYAALNEALALSTGEWVRMMADDDDYLPGSVHHIVSCMRDHPDALGVGGMSSFESWDPADAARRGNTGRMTGELTMRSCVDFQQPLLYSHEAMYFRRQPLLSVGGWDTRFAVCGDLDVQFRLLRTGGSFFVVPFEVLHAKRHRGSATVRLRKRAFFELLYIMVRSRQWWFLRQKVVDRSRRLIKLVWR
jgi:glycosyltransferase involved in cell wall biosynthesis